jgi:hypothetical protein
MTKLAENNPQGTANIADDRVLAVGYTSTLEKLPPFISNCNYSEWVIGLRNTGQKEIGCFVIDPMADCYNKIFMGDNILCWRNLIGFEKFDVNNIIGWHDCP